MSVQLVDINSNEFRQWYKDSIKEAIVAAFDEANYIHSDRALDTIEAAKFLGINTNIKPSSVSSKMSRLTNPKYYNPPLKRCKYDGNKYVVQDLIEFMKEHKI